MGEINSQTYKSYTGSFIPVRDDNNSLLSITSSTEVLNDDSQYVELSSSYNYITTESLSDLIDTNFTELIISTTATAEIPTGTLLLSQSDYDFDQATILNLESDMITSQSQFEASLQDAYSQNTALLSTVQSINSSALDITNNLISKYTQQNNIDVVNDLNELKFLWFIPFDDIINNTSQLVNRKIYYSGSIVYYSSSVQNNIPTGISTSIKNEEVSYSLAFDGSYLQNLYKDYVQTGQTFSALQVKIKELEIVTSSLLTYAAGLQQQIDNLQEKLVNLISSGSFGSELTGKLNLIITAKTGLDKYLPGESEPDVKGQLSGKWLTVIPQIQDQAIKDAYTNTIDLSKKWDDTNGHLIEYLVVPVGNLKLDWTPIWQQFEMVTITDFKVSVGGKIQTNITKNSINNLIVNINKNETTTISMVLNALI